MSFPPEATHHSSSSSMRKGSTCLNHQHMQSYVRVGQRLKCSADICSFLALSKSLEMGLSPLQLLQYSDLCSEMLSAENLVRQGCRMLDLTHFHVDGCTAKQELAHPAVVMAAGLICVSSETSLGSWA